MAPSINKPEVTSNEIHQASIESKAPRKVKPPAALAESADQAFQIRRGGFPMTERYIDTDRADLLEEFDEHALVEGYFEQDDDGDYDEEDDLE